jgi:ABC-2 type transport system ATP-binding protein
MSELSPAIATTGLCRTFGGEAALTAVDLEVAFGEIHALVGLNGAGKTTLMRMLLGMVHPTSGSARVLDREAQSAPPDTWRAVGSLIETPFSYPELTVRQNLVASALLHGVDRASIPAAVDDVIERFQLDTWRNRSSRTLSLGNRQRLGLASSVIHDPSILILDEPANALDPAGVVFIRDFLRESADKGTAILVSSHHLDQLARIADHITLLHHGRIVGELDPTGMDLERQFFDRVSGIDIAEGTK